MSLADTTMKTSSIDKEIYSSSDIVAVSVRVVAARTEVVATFVSRRIFHRQYFERRTGRRGIVFALVDGGKTRAAVSRRILLSRADAAAFPMALLSVRAWIITTVPFSGARNSLEASERAYETLSHGTFVLKIAREILMDGSSV